MNMLAEIWETISRHKLRTAVTGFSVAWGIFLLVILLAVGNGLRKGVAYQFRDDALNSMWIWPGKTSIAYQGMAKNRQIKFENSDFELLKNSIPEIEYISGRFDEWGARDMNANGKSAGFSLKGAHPDYRHIENSEILKGRYLNVPDIENARKIAIVGQPVADFFYPGENPIGKPLIVGKTNFTIAGMFNDNGGDRENRMIHIPISTAQSIFHQPLKIDRLIFTMGDATLKESRELESKVRTLLARKHKVHPDDTRAIGIRNNFETFKRFDDLIRFITYFVGFVGIMTLVAGVVGVGNILLITVKERTAEFGLRRALGASPQSIIALLITEALFITLFSGYLGLISGLGLLELVNQTAGDMGYIKDPAVDLSIALQAIVVLVLTGILTGLLPAYRAVKIHPIEALRNNT